MCIEIILLSTNAMNFAIWFWFCFVFDVERTRGKPRAVLFVRFVSLLLLLVLCILFSYIHMDACMHAYCCFCFFLISDLIVFRMAHSHRDENPLFLFNRENGMIVWCALLPICYLFDKIDKSHQWHTMQWMHCIQQTHSAHCADSIVATGNKGHHTHMKIHRAHLLCISTQFSSAQFGVHSIQLVWVCVNVCACLYVHMLQKSHTIAHFGLGGELVYVSHKKISVKSNTYLSENTVTIASRV